MEMSRCNIRIQGAKVKDGDKSSVLLKNNKITLEKTLCNNWVVDQCDSIFGE